MTNLYNSELRTFKVGLKGKVSISKQWVIAVEVCEGLIRVIAIMSGSRRCSLKRAESSLLYMYRECCEVVYVVDCWRDSTPVLGDLLDVSKDIIELI
jgi:hypothetical protein